jgi:hypothetical protein
VRYASSSFTFYRQLIVYLLAGGYASSSFTFRVCGTRNRRCFPQSLDFHGLVAARFMAKRLPDQTPDLADTSPFQVNDELAYERLLWVNDELAYRN